MANNDYITTDCKLTVSKNTAKLDEEIFLYKNDRNIKLLIEIVDNKYRYKSDDLSNLLVKYKASYAQVKWYKNAEVKKEFPIQATDDGKVVFVIEGQLIDEDTELGDYDLQLRLLNESQESIRSLPIIKGAVHILKPLFEEGDIAIVNSAIADVSMLSLDGDAIDTYNSDGTYNQTNWGNGDVISSAKLNKLEKVAKDNVDKVNKMPAKSIVEGGKIYLAKEDGTKLDSGTELPAGGSTIEVVNNLESDSTTAALSAAQGKALNTQYKDIANKIESGLINTTNTNDTLPRVYLVGDEFSNMTVQKNEVPMQLSFRHGNNNFDASIKIKFQGSSSLSYAKKNFTVKMFTDSTYTTKLKKQFKNWGLNVNKYVLKANWIDRTHARNIISARIWGDIVKTRKTIPAFMQNCPNSGAVDGFPVKLFVNGEYQGMYTWNLAKDAYLFNFTDETNSFICCGESNAGMFYDTGGWSVEYPDVAPASWTTLLTNFVNFIKTSTDEEFKTNFSQYADLDSFIDYYIFAYVNCGLDSLGKNIILTSNTGDKLYISAYDLDSTWGLFWNGTSIVDYNYPCPDSYQENNSALWKRFEPIFKDEIYNRYTELTAFGMPLNPVNLIERFEDFDEIVTQDLIKEDREIFTGLPSVGSYKQIRTFINKRKVYVDECMVKIKNGTMHADKQIESISINESISQLSQGSTAQLTVSVTPSDITDYTVIWSSTKAEIATVSTSGLVTALKIGQTTITAKVGDKTASIALSVTDNKSLLKVQLNANTAYLFVGDNEIVKGNVTTALPINTTSLGYTLSNAGTDFSSIIKCEGKKYVSGTVVKTTDEECIGAGWGIMWIRILNETLNGKAIKNWAVENKLEFSYDLSSVNMKWADYTLPTDRTWTIENLGDSYYKCYIKYCNTDNPTTTVQFNFPAVWYNNNISHTQTDYYGNTTRGLFMQAWNGSTNLCLTIKKTDLSANTSAAVNEYLTNNPIILKYPTKI